MTIALIHLLRHVLRRLDEASSWCRLVGHTPCWRGDTVSCKQCGIPLDR